MKWKREAINVSHVEIVDTDGDGRLEIVHSESDAPWLGGQRILIRDANGKILRRFKTDFWEFSLCQWSSKKAKWHLLGVADDAIRIVDFTGKAITEFPAPPGRVYAEATPVQFEGESSPFFAIVVSLRVSTHRSILYIYSTQGKLIYQEIFVASLPSITVLPSEKSGAETLLVGADEGKVWQYKRHSFTEKTQ